jgi:hypothetical protein
MVRVVNQLLDDGGFQLALALALLGSGAVAFAHLRGWYFGIEAGFIATLATVFALAVKDRDALLSSAGLVLLGIGAALTRDREWLLRAAAAAPGAVLFLLALDTPVPNWARLTLALAIVLFSPFVTTFDATSPRLVPVLLAITAFGMWSTTPDTEHGRVLFGAVAGAAVLGLDRRLQSGAVGTALIVGLLSWSAVLDGYPRRGAVMGALACFGVTVILPFLAPRRRVTSVIPIAIVLVTQGVLVVVCARVAGLRDEAAPALAIAAVTWVVCGVILSRVFPLRRRD